MIWSKKHLDIWAKGAKRKSTQRKYDYRNKLLDRQAANDLALKRIEAILGEIEELHRELGGGREPTDSEALRIVNRIEKRMMNAGRGLGKTA